MKKILELYRCDLPRESRELPIDKITLDSVNWDARRQVADADRVVFVDMDGQAKVLKSILIGASPSSLPPTWRSAARSLYAAVQDGEDPSSAMAIVDELLAIDAARSESWRDAKHLCIKNRRTSRFTWGPEDIE